jgi:hypothetical protein
MSALTSALLSTIDGRGWAHFLRGESGEHLTAMVDPDEAVGIILAAMASDTPTREAACVTVAEHPCRVVVFRWARLEQESEAWQTVQAALRQEVAA